MSDNQESPLTFPCSFPIKAMGLAASEFEVVAIEIVQRHYPTFSETCVRKKASSNSKYLSITFTIEATSRQQLDSIYQDLSDCVHVLMAL